MVAQLLLYGIEVQVVTIPLNAQNEIKKIENIFWMRQLGVKYNTSYHVIVLKIGALSIEILALCRVYRYIAKVKKWM